ncbi:MULTISPECIES: carbon-nitrogen hydrolase family protein [Micrococcaceae]|uniref:carbon-nitrogen hydrolase family protein n=1 Tax=unclassified Kocuria TaxID=2649579 RepID=UPI0010113F0D|nr:MULTISPECIES: carbon-nitrogen hydrolase family protein [unclassified Kocuria]
MKAALVQMNSVADPRANLRTIADRTAKAAKNGASLVVFPEATQTPFGTDLMAAAEELGGPWTTRLEAIARENGVTVIAGMFRPGTDGTVKNTLVARGVDPEGTAVAAHYDKVHLFDAFGHKESDSVSPGQTIRTFSFGDLTIGLAICYDVRFPPLFTAQARSGADAIVVSASWGSGPGKIEQWELLGQARALDATAYVLACGQADPRITGAPAAQDSPTGVGHSYVAGPKGELIASADAGDEIIYAELSPHVVRQTRAAIPVLANSLLEGEVAVVAE